MLMLEVELVLGAAGTPGTTGLLPWLTPSSVKLTVPDGAWAPVPALVDVTTAVTVSALPGEGVDVAGVTTVEVGLGWD
jgi:hypothetical protein